MRRKSTTIRVEVLKDCFCADDAVELELGNPHPDRGKLYASIGQQGVVVASNREDETVDVILDGETFVTEMDWTEIKVLTDAPVDCA